MLSKIKQMLKQVKADYADIRYERKSETAITFSGKELSTIGSNDTDGFVVRVLHQGGFSSVTFTQESDAATAIRKAEENAKLFSENQTTPVKFAPVDPVKDDFSPILDEDPRKISMEEKLELVRKYNDIPLKHEKIVNTNLGYLDCTREKFFVSTEGAEIHEDLITTRFAGMLTSRDGNLLQNLRVAAGGSDGFGNVRNLEAILEQRSQIVLDLLTATPIKGGAYNCILNPSMAGVFTHEAFGHFSEADIVESLPAMRAKMKLGSQLGSSIVNIIDDATQLHQLGFYKYDDEGVPVQKVQLMKDGILTGRLHSRRTAAVFNEPVSGHAVAEDFRYAPIVRMGSIFIEPGDQSLEEMMQQLGDGLYILDPKGGQTAGESFTFGAQYGYYVKNGQKAGMIRDINITGNLYKTLKNISAIGNDFALGKIGGCGKGQTNIRSCYGGPHILINDLVIGGTE